MRDADEIKAAWQIHGEGGCQHHVTLLSPKPKPCNTQCPWLASNDGRSAELYYDHEVDGIPMSEGEYDFAAWRRARVWANDLKDGLVDYGSTCHVRLRGTAQRPDGGWDVVSHQCTGALVMQQREVLRHVQSGDSALAPHGAARVASDMLGRDVAEDELGELDIRELLDHAHPSLLDPAIGSKAVAPPLTAHELREWESRSG